MTTDKSNILCVLNILQDYSDESHILNAKDINEKLRAIYGRQTDRRTVYSAIDALIVMGYDISTFEENRKGFYLREREFDQADVRLLIDAVSSFEYISKKQTDELIKKLQLKLPVHDRKRFGNSNILRTDKKSPNSQVFLNIELLDQAINEKKKVRIPSNLFILATMNTSDQNVFTLDTAFKRRWSMKHIENNIDGCVFGNYPVCGSDITWRAFAKTINDLIIEVSTENLSNEDNRLGAYFVRQRELDDSRLFGEKVLMYLWNDAFKYDHDKVFRSEYRTLDQLINGFIENGMDVFADEVDFSVDISYGVTSIEMSGKETPVESYLAGKNSHLIAYYNALRDLVKDRLPDARESSTKSLQYAAWRSDNITKSSFADFQIQNDRILIFTEIPSESYIAIGEEIPKDGHHNHYFKIIYNESSVDQIVEIIVESYEQLKKE